ncbi:MAG: AraC family transcriptional regulator [Maribacter sp.]
MLELFERTNQDHLRIMANHFDAVFEQGEGASSIRLQNHWGNGTIGCYDLFPGLNVWVYNLVFYKKFEVELALSEEGPIYFCYNAKGDYGHRCSDQETVDTILENQNMIFSGCPSSNVYISFPTNKKLEIAVIVVDLDKLKKSESRNAKRMSDGLGTLFKRVSKEQPYLYLGAIDPETAKFASVVCNNNDTTLVGQLLTEGAVLNMLAAQIREFGTGITDIGRGAGLTRTEQSRISSLGKYVMENLQESITVPKLCEHYGLSQKKLQVGVKKLFGDTVSQYVSNVRMDHAMHLFTATDLNVSEVAHEVGIPNIAYFSLLFKKRFGTRPSNFRRLIKERSTNIRFDGV